MGSSPTVCAFRDLIAHAREGIDFENLQVQVKGRVFMSRSARQRHQRAHDLFHCIRLRILLGIGRHDWIRTSDLFRVKEAL